jgi:hypothetical protein
MVTTGSSCSGLGSMLGMLIFVHLSHKLTFTVNSWMHSVCAVFQINHAGTGKSSELQILFFQLVILLKLPLHAIFVFNGLNCLPDKGCKARNSSHWLTCDFQQMVELFGFQSTEVCFACSTLQCHCLTTAQAPSEAEAELAAMNCHGVIDAVITEDSNILIFEALCIIRLYGIILLLSFLPLTVCDVRKYKDYLNIQLYTEDGLKHGASLTQGDQLLITLLMGRDYDTGVPGCGMRLYTRLLSTAELVRLCSMHSCQWHQRISPSMPRSS